MSTESRPLTPNRIAGYEQRKKLRMQRDQAILKAYNKEYAKGLRPDVIMKKLAPKFFLSEKTIYRVLLRV